MTPKQLRRADQIKEQIEKLQGELNKLAALDGASRSTQGRAGRTMSAAARKKIADAQKASGL